ncbi:hypothetical protein Bca4012_050090 [Brassica carinata]
MSKAPSNSSNTSTGQCGSSEEPLPPPLKSPSPEPARLPSPDLLIFNPNVPQSPTLTLPENFKFPDPPVVPQSTTEPNQTNTLSENLVEPQQQHTPLEIYNEHMNLFGDTPVTPT